MQWTLTPPHEVLTERQASKALRDIQVSFEKLPLLAYGDAAIKQLIASGVEVNVGDVIRITRQSITSGEVYYYRRVVA